MRRFLNRHRGERCAVLLNGESVEGYSPADSPGLVFGTNHSWSHAPSVYHCVIDWKQLQWAAEAEATLGTLFVGKAEATERARESTERKRQFYPRLRTTEIVELLGREGRKNPDFVTDFGRELWIPNVAIFALELAAGMGFSRVDLWGLDLTGPKFWKKDWEIGRTIAEMQDRQLRFAAPILKGLGIEVVNRNPRSMCGAFPKEA